MSESTGMPRAKRVLAKGIGHVEGWYILVAHVEGLCKFSHSRTSADWAKKPGECSKEGEHNIQLRIVALIEVQVLLD